MDHNEEDDKIRVFLVFNEVNSAKLVQLQIRPKQYAGRCSLACLLQYKGLKIWVLGGYSCKRFVGAEAGDG
ncbi:hypothetical protein MKW98_026687 [Papaver atlanticum]|uniref:Uncharacterized protein n=1 Tax=Papaver atlanticum TaxID=357466 RepID=A0AAD4RZN8_9MAGN|nr:hypothetical protein MKW98_026687 [Papaver atlanticum]